jgi:hypothetical protein
MPAKGSAKWRGDLRTGAGTFAAGGTISGGYPYTFRFQEGPGSNPEQLVAAAHASCFSMALANALAESGHPPDLVRTDATVTLRPVEGAPTVTKVCPGEGWAGARSRRSCFCGSRHGREGGMSGEQGIGKRAGDHARSIGRAVTADTGGLPCEGNCIFGGCVRRMNAVVP